MPVSTKAASFFGKNSVSFCLIAPASGDSARLFHSLDSWGVAFAVFPGLDVPSVCRVLHKVEIAYQHGGSILTEYCMKGMNECNPLFGRSRREVSYNNVQGAHFQRIQLNHHQSALGDNIGLNSVKLVAEGLLENGADPPLMSREPSAPVPGDGRKTEICAMIRSPSFLVSVSPIIGYGEFRISRPTSINVSNPAFEIKRWLLYFVLSDFAPPQKK